MAGDPRKEHPKASWLKLFSAFRVALDPKKLLLAGFGLLAMSLGWWVLSVAFYALGSKEPERKNYDKDEVFARDFDRWFTLHTLAGPGGRLRSLPWFESRGRNPYLLVTDSLKDVHSDVQRDSTLRKRDLLAWLLSDQVPVMIEPLVKVLLPFAYFFDPGAGGFLNRTYLILAILWSLAVWGLFGGAITRMAVVQVARNERVGLFEALRFARSRLVSYIAAPVLPLVFLGILTCGLLLLGLFTGWTFALGDLLSGLLWPLVLIIGLVMAVVLVGLVGWPLMNPTISAEGSDSFDALSRSYSYVYQSPWQYLWYSAVSMLYGAVVIFFVGFMGSLLVYLGKWGMTQAPLMDQRDPAYLFAYAPTSFGWRDLLLHDSPHARPTVVTPPGELPRPINPEKQPPVAGYKSHYELTPEFADSINWHNKIGAILVSAWLYLFFLLIVGFGYSFFWSAASIIYLLMRQRIDDTDLDEIHTEEDDDAFLHDHAAAPPAASASAPSSAPSSTPPGVSFTMVDAPTLKKPDVPTTTEVTAPGTNTPPTTSP